MTSLIGRLLLVLLVLAPVLSADLGACCCPEKQSCCCAPVSDCRETQIELAPNLIWSQAILPPRSESLTEPAQLAAAHQAAPLELLQLQHQTQALSEHPPPPRPPPLAAMTVLLL